MEPVTLAQVIDATRGTGAGSVCDDTAVTRICTDSREVQQGDLFWAIRGERHDGHEFVADALAKGAAACVVEHLPAENSGLPLICVESSLPALGDLARWYRTQREALIIGVTGSVGKTTTREMIYAALQSTHRGLQSQKNFNNEIGLPLSVLELESDHEFGVFEMGARTPGNIRALCEIACPEVGVITRIGPCHLETFGTLEAIFQTKGELLEALPPHGFAVLGGDDDRMREMASRAMCSSILVGERAGNQMRATDIIVSADRLRFTVDRKKYEVPGAGRQHVTAALCAIAVAREIGLDAGEISSGLMTFVSQPGRGQPLRVGPWTVIDDTYNASPLSMEAACFSLRDWNETGPRIFITGDMLELGSRADDYHRELGGTIAGAGIDHLLALGSQAPQVVSGAQVKGLPASRIAECEQLDVLLAILDCWLEPGAVIAVKGSRGMQMERIVEWLKRKGLEEDKRNNARHPKRAVA